MMPFPHHYRVTLANRQLLAPPRVPIDAGPPPQFGGDEHRWSPEELLVGAVLECLWTTFEAFARRDKLQVNDWTGAGLATLDRGPHVPVFTSIALAVSVRVAAGDEERARTLLRKAEQQCIISQALNVPVIVDVTVTT
jgi:organic hydroperoxide reductase OsmC/OhrA